MINKIHTSMDNEKIISKNIIEIIRNNILQA